MEVTDLERRHRQKAEQSLLRDINVRLQKYHEVAQSEVNPLGKYATTQTYGEEAHPSATLVTLLRPKPENATVLEVSDEQGALLCMTEQVSETVSQYYTDLYASHLSHNNQAMSDYLARIATSHGPITSC
ncbi:hypothetical protein NDU88_005841 [Pleurodeles waltl]|uniref:Uncharacterized protein n=1 Tax=Pleurodeles waltl TaxID=8319 RepID=A0AAV7NQ39_PLEWA|nr:hypothetical protein NDU88_005841 [Pleurodeles waltl]